MSCGILRCNGDSILGSDCGNLLKNAILDASLNLLDLLKSLFLSQTVQEEIDVTCRCLKIR